MKPKLLIETKDDAPDVASAIADLTKSFEEKMTKLAGDVKAANDRADALETQLARPAVHKATETEATPEAKAFALFLSGGEKKMSVDEVKTLRSSNDAQGGYLAPAEFVAEVDKNVVQFSPVRQAARVGSTASGSVIVPKRTGKPTGGWVGELESRPSTESAYGQAEIPIDEAACYVDVSNKLLEDASIDVAAEVAFDIGEEFGRLEGAAFVSGDGVKKPLGFMSDAGVLSANSGSAAAIGDADGGVNGIIALMYALAPFYRSRGVFMANGFTIAALRKLKDDNKNYIWQPAVAAGQPETLLGRPIVEAVDMPDIAADAFPLVFGDFASAYRIYDRTALTILRDPYTQATNGVTRFHARRRVGARIVRAEAIRKLKIAA